jgi:hypothetical protein
MVTMSKYATRRKFDGRWYYLNDAIHRGNVKPISKKDAKHFAEISRSGGIKSRIVKVKGGYLVYKRHSTDGGTRPAYGSRSWDVFRKKSKSRKSRRK